MDRSYYDNKESINFYSSKKGYIEKWKEEENKKKIIKAEALYSILKIAGLTDEMVAMLSATHIFEISLIDKDLIKYYDVEKYAFLAYLLRLIEAEDVKTSKYLHTLDSVTVKDCLGMMNKFLSKNPSYGVIYEAKANGLLKDNDSFIDRVDDDLTYEDLCVLLYRMATNNICHYINFNQNSEIRMFYLNNNDNNMTYLDLLDSKYVDKRYKNFMEKLDMLYDRYNKS